jgi:hypothetical protein
MLGASEEEFDAARSDNTLEDMEEVRARFRANFRLQPKGAPTLLPSKLRHHLTAPTPLNPSPMG